MRSHSLVLLGLAILLLPATALALERQRPRGVGGTLPALQTAELRFGVFTLGAKAFDVDMQLAREADGMKVVSGVRSTGPANLLLRFRMESELRLGFGPEGKVSPLRYASHSDGSFSRRTILMIWGPDGLPQASVEPAAAADDRDPVLPEQTRNTFDPTTALLARALAQEAAAPCTGTDQIFDGRRRYNLHYQPAGMENIPAYQRSAYAGAAMKCQLRFEPIAGYSRKYMDNTRKLEDEVTEMWVARLPGQPVWLPVRLRSAWMLGDLDGHIQSASINGREVLKPVDLTPPPAPPNIAP